MRNRGPRAGAAESDRASQLLQPAELWCAGGCDGVGRCALKASWLAEVEAMRTRILAMRQELVDVLKEAVPGVILTICSSSAGCSATPVERGAG
jgi:hypothetical protein